MKIILGIDIGGSSTKIVGYNEEKLISLLQVNATDPITSAYGALGSFLEKNKLNLKQINQIVLTGVGAAQIQESMYNIPTIRVNEFNAIGLGGLELTNLKEAIVVSIGTGTAFIKVTEKEIKHIGGSGVGGGTILNLCSKFAGVNSFESIVETSTKGDLGRIDLRIKDIVKEKIGNLELDTTAANFGKLTDEATNADITLGIINMVFETIGMMSVFACQNDKIKNIVIVGSTATIPKAKNIFLEIEKLYKIKFYIPENAKYATAIGAAMTYLKKI